MLDAAPDAIVGVDADGIIVMANIQTEALFGYERSELIGRPVEVLVPDRAKGMHPGHREGYFKSPRTRPMGAGLDLAGRRADGTEFPAEISLSSIETGAGPLALAAIRDTTDRKKAEKETRLAREEADRANQAKSEFLSRVSHELRTPLNAILGFGQLLKLDDLTPNQADSVDQILSGGEHLLDLINEVLDIARIESGRMALSIEPVHLGMLVDETTQLVRPLANQQQVTLSGLKKPSNVYVLADRQRLKQVFLNLLSNAVKYNREGGQASITIDEHADTCRATITDTGHGIAPERMDKVFTAFDRGGAEVSSIQGTGLGLALSKGLIREMRGEIGVESTPGVGSTFWIDLPLAQEPQSESATTDHGVPKVGEAGERTVLYIEDNPSNLKLVQRILSHRPLFKLLSATEALPGIELAHQHRPDLILLDLHLPDMPGEEALRRFQADPNTREIPVIVISADASSGTTKSLLASGAQSFLTKPLDVATFLQTLDEALT